MAVMERHTVIENFVADYDQRRDYFRKIAEICHDQCRDALVGEAIRHFASFRAKSSKRLREKLYQRLQKRQQRNEDYADAATIQSDIPDFAGVRIALYFPADAPAAVRILRETFVEAEEPRTFTPNTDRANPDGYVYRFGGYSATHLRVRLKRESLTHYEEATAYAKARIEIQIASVFMHAWAEVEHDLVYKPQEGTLSSDEYSLLDQVNGLSYAAEVALEQLQRTKTRTANRQIPIPNHYDLAAYIHTHATHLTAVDPPMGRADRLHTFLSRLNLNRPDKLDELIRKIPNLPTGKPLVEHIVEIVIDSDPAARDSRRRIWNDVVQASLASNPYTGEPSVITYDEGRLLINHFRTFDEVGRRVVRGLTGGRGRPSLLERDVIEKTLAFDRVEAGSILAAYDAYARYITGNWKGSNNELEHHAAALERGLRSLHARFPHLLTQEVDR